MDRIARGIETLSAAAPPETGEQESLRAALDDEKLANAQLSERLSALTGRMEELERRLEASGDAVEKAVDAREAAELALSTARAELATMTAAREAAEQAAQAGADEIAGLRRKLEDQLRQSEAATQQVQVVDLERNREVLDQFERRLGRMRRTSRQLRGANQQLRDAVENGLPDANLINQSLVSELNNLKAIRDAELAEIEVITTALRPLLGSAEPGAPDAGMSKGEN